MKKESIILVITSDRSRLSDNSWHERELAVEQFCASLNNRLDNVSVVYTTYNDLIFTASNDGITIYDARNQYDMADFSFVHFKNWQYNAATAPVVAHYLDQKGVPFANTEVLNLAATGKLAQMFLLATGGVTIPVTVATSAAAFRDMAANNLPAPLTYPVIFKADDGAKGEDNYLVKNPREFDAILNTIEEDREFILQEFIANEGDYRYLFIGRDEDPIVFLRRGSGETHLNNTSKGGSGEFQPLNGEVARNAHIAKRAVLATGKEIGGVDIIIDMHTKKPYVLEVNGTPAIATGFGKEEKLDKFAEFIEGLIDSREEE